MPSMERPSPDFLDLVADVADALDGAVPVWRARLLEATGHWRGRGVRTDVLERALTLPEAPDVDALLATFARAVDHLAALEVEAVGLDPALVGAPIFRDPARVREAAALVAGRRPPLAPVRSGYPDGEHWVLTWPDVGDLLTGGLA